MRARGRPPPTRSIRAAVCGAWVTKPVSITDRCPPSSNSTLFEDSHPRSSTCRPGGSRAAGAQTAVRGLTAIFRGSSSAHAALAQLFPDSQPALAVETGPAGDLLQGPEASDAVGAGCIHPAHRVARRRHFARRVGSGSGGGVARVHDGPGVLFFWSRR